MVQEPVGADARSTCFLDGRFLPLSQARISPMDRGFLFGDGAYEVIPVYSRRAFRLDEHLRRLQTTLNALKIENPHTLLAWREIVLQLVDKNEWADQSVYLQVSRGAESKRNHVFPTGVAPTVFLMCDELKTADEALRRSGVGAITAPDYRWLRCDLKTTSLLANCLLRNLAVECGCAETILLRDGRLTEGSASNIFVVRDGLLLTPPKSRFMLPGITYDVVLEIARERGVPHQVRDVSEEELRSADEIWLTSSTKEVLPISTLDGKPVGDGQPAQLAAQMFDWYQQFKTTVMRNG